MSTKNSNSNKSSESYFIGYLNYLKTRSWRSFVYRKFWLYPIISSKISGNVLDVGCGIGDFLRFQNDSVGVDVNPGTVEYCKSIGLNVQLIDHGKIPFSTEFFNSAVLDNVLEHINDPSDLLIEIRRVLSENGVLIIGVPGIVGYNRDPDHKVFYDEIKLKTTLLQYGFEAKSVFYAPFESRFLEKHMFQYCLYGVFEKIKM
jgi:SAM-dependent methyltransferase